MHLLVWILVQKHAEEIALSIIAEIKAVFAQRQGASLKERTTEIHERSI